MREQPPCDSRADHVTLQRKVVLLSQRGLWPQLERLAHEHGWLSSQVEEFADGHLPSATCPVCGKSFCATTKRAKYCSLACRQAAAAERDRKRQRSTKQAKEGLPHHRQAALATRRERFIRLERGSPGQDEHRFYTLMVVQTLFGKTAVIKKWGRTDNDRPQTLKMEFDSVDGALDEIDRVVRLCLARDYQLIPAETNPHQERILLPGQVKNSIAVSRSMAAAAPSTPSDVADRQPGDKPVDDRANVPNRMAPQAHVR